MRVDLTCVYVECGESVCGRCESRVCWGTEVSCVLSGYVEGAV